MDFSIDINIKRRREIIMYMCDVTVILFFIFLILGIFSLPITPINYNIFNETIEIPSEVFQYYSQNTIIDYNIYSSPSKANLMGNHPISMGYLEILFLSTLIIILSAAFKRWILYFGFQFAYILPASLFYSHDFPTTIITIGYLIAIRGFLKNYKNINLIIIGSFIISLIMQTSIFAGIILLIYSIMKVEDKRIPILLSIFCIMIGILNCIVNIPSKECGALPCARMIQYRAQNKLSDSTFSPNILAERQKVTAEIDMITASLPIQFDAQRKYITAQTAFIRGDWTKAKAIVDNMNDISFAKSKWTKKRIEFLRIFAKTGTVWLKYEYLKTSFANSLFISLSSFFTLLFLALLILSKLIGHRIKNISILQNKIKAIRLMA